MNIAFAGPPDYYKKFQEGDNALSPPDLALIKSQAKTYFMFGKIMQFDPESNNEGLMSTLEQKLIPDTITDYKAELKKLNYSLLSKIIKFFQVAGTSEFESAAIMLEDIKKLTNNFYYALAMHKQNILAKKNLIEFRKAQLQETEDEIQNIQKKYEELLGKLENFTQGMSKILL